MAYYLNYDSNTDSLSVGYSENGINTLFESYEEKGYNNNRPPITIGDSGFTFTIETNFGFSYRSYLRFKIEYKGSNLYSFRNKMGKYAVEGPSTYFCVEPDPKNWYDLLLLLCEVYRNRDCWNLNQCLEWQEARIINKIIVKTPLHLAKSLSAYFSMLKSTHLGLCAPVLEGIKSICEKELPVLVANILNNNPNKENIDYAKEAISLAFEYMSSIDHMELFLKAISYNK